MSSHHIVRDNQEPALIVLEASQISFEVIEELLEWSPSIIVHESQIELFLHRGIKIDAVLFEYSNQTEIIEKIKNQLPVHLLSYQSGNPLARALSFLQEKNHSHVNIISGSIGFLNLLKSLDHPKNISVFHQNLRWSLVRSGHFEKWVPNDVRILLYEGNEPIALSADKEHMIKINRTENFWVGETLKD